jgi:hypothetical protein
MIGLDVKRQFYSTFVLTNKSIYIDKSKVDILVVTAYRMGLIRCSFGNNGVSDTKLN